MKTDRQTLGVEAFQHSRFFLGFLFFVFITTVALLFLLEYYRRIPCYLKDPQSCYDWGG